VSTIDSDRGAANAWDESVDVVVVGSGSGGMVAAITAHDEGKNVIVLEKSSLYGGTSATSGHGVWVPCNRYAKEAEDYDDSPAEAATYIKNVTPLDKVPEYLIDRYVDQAPKMIDYLYERTHLEFVNHPTFPDYFSFAEGSKPGNRSLEPIPLHGRVLGPEFERMQPLHQQLSIYARINVTQREGQWLLGRQKGWLWKSIAMVLQYLLDIPSRLRGKRDRRMTAGQAGVGRLRLSMLERNIPIKLNTDVRKFHLDDNGRVNGVAALRDGKVINIEAKAGVIVAAGGFEKNQSMREEFLPGPTHTSWTAAHGENTGDALKAALDIGAATSQMDDAWWTTTMLVPGESKGRLVVIEKAQPWGMVVNKGGRRYANEAQNYVDFVKAIYSNHRDDDPTVPSFLVFDSKYRRTFPCGPILTPDVMPDWAIPKAWWTPDFLTKADTIEELAATAGISYEGLKAEIEKFNGYAVTGKDLDFGRGDGIYDRTYVSGEIKPNPCLGPLDKPPYYCVKIFPGEMGTMGGMNFNEHAQVLRADGSAIEGLYTAGNCSAALLPTYPGAGSTIGPSMTFGYLAGRHASGNAA